LKSEGFDLLGRAEDVSWKNSTQVGRLPIKGKNLVVSKFISHETKKRGRGFLEGTVGVGLSREETVSKKKFLNGMRESL